MAIDQYIGEYEFLSNDFPCKVKFGGQEYPSVEHAFLASRCTDEKDRIEIKISAIAGVRKVKPYKGWESDKEHFLCGLLYQKFYRHIDLGTKLLDTGGEKLASGNGTILMKIRKELSAYRKKFPNGVPNGFGTFVR